MDLPSSSIIIVNWNGRHHLEQSIPAVQAQSLAPHEIIVVDNASTDDSVAFLSRCYPQVRLVQLTENRGFSGGNIAGYEVARGDYIVLLNNDTKPLPDWLEQLVTCAQAHPEAGIIASHMTDWEGRFTDTAGDGCRVTGRGFQMHKHKPTTMPPPSGYVFSACAGAALYKRKMLDQIGFLDASYFMNAEDTDLAFRAQLKGWKVYLCASAMVRHRISGSQGATSDLNVFYNTRNHIWTYVKCMPRVLVLKYGWIFFAELILKWIFYLKRGQGIVYVRGIVAALGGLSKMLAARTQVQAKRRIDDADLERSLTMPRFFARDKRET